MSVALLLLLVGSGLSQPTMEQFDSCDANSRVVDAVTENLKDVSNIMNKTNEDVGEKLLAFEKKVRDQTAKDITQKLDDLQRKLNNLGIPTTDAEQCNDTVDNSPYNKPCKRAWHQIGNRCFLIPLLAYPVASAAQDLCLRYNAKLAVLDSEALLNETLATFQLDEKDCFWVASIQKVTEPGNWYWTNCNRDVYGIQTCTTSRNQVNETLWSPGYPKYSGCETIMGKEWCNDQSSLFSCLHKTKLINRGNERRAPICEYTLS